MRAALAATLIAATTSICGPSSPPPDSDHGADSGMAIPDSGPHDAGAPDAGFDAGVDAGPVDAGKDAGAPDAGVDAGPPQPPDPFSDGGQLFIQGSDSPDGGVELQVAQLFQVTRVARPGSVRFTVTLQTDDNLIEDSTLWLDVVELSDGGTIPDGFLECGVPDSSSVVAHGILNRRLLTYREEDTRRVNLRSNVFLVPGTTYAVVFRSEHPSQSLFRIATTTTPTTTSDVSLGATLARAIARSGGACGLSSGWLQADALLDVDITVDDGCTIGATSSCGRGSCFRTIPQCDAYGEFNSCHPNSCTGNGDCRFDWNHPERGTYWNAQCTNPTGLAFAGTCPSQPELDNGLDDDCNGATDDALPQASCGTGACATTVARYDEVGRPNDCVAAEPQPSPEQCDGLDNDCDGVTDNWLPNTAMCGFGACRRSVYSCILYPDPDWGTAATCTPDMSQSSAEACDGLDNNCNGVTDDMCH